MPGSGGACPGTDSIAGYDLKVTRHFLTGEELGGGELAALLARAADGLSKAGAAAAG